MNSNNQLYREILFDLLTSDYDNKSTTSEKYAEQLLAIQAQFVKRNDKLTELLYDYIEQRKIRIRKNSCFKNIIFWFFIVLLAVFTVGIIIFIIFNKNINSIPSAISLISVLAAYFASLIAVFEIISKYLFPIDEEKDANNMIQTVISNDLKVEELMSSFINKSHTEVFEKLKMLKQLLDDGSISADEFNEIKTILIKEIKDK